MALACGVKTSVTIDLNSSSIDELTSAPFSLANAFCNDPRWSMAAAAITPRLSETAFIPASFPGVSFTVVLLDIVSCVNFLGFCAESGIDLRGHSQQFRDARHSLRVSYCTKLEGYFGIGTEVIRLEDQFPLHRGKMEQKLGNPGFFEGRFNNPLTE